MRALHKVCISLALCICCGCFGAHPVDPHLIGAPAPEARFTMMDGERVALSSFSGKTVVIVFWQSTCSKSKRELEDLRDFAGRFEQNAPVEFIAVSVDKAERRNLVEEKIRALASHKIVFAFSGNDVQDEAFRLFSGEEVPFLVVIDPRGKIVAAGDSSDVYEEAVRLGASSAGGKGLSKNGSSAESVSKKQMHRQ